MEAPRVLTNSVETHLASCGNPRVLVVCGWVVMCDSCIAAARFSRVTPTSDIYGHTRSVKGHAHVQFGMGLMRGSGVTAAETTELESFELH